MLDHLKKLLFAEASGQEPVTCKTRQAIRITWNPQYTGIKADVTKVNHSLAKTSSGVRFEYEKLILYKKKKKKEKKDTLYKCLRMPPPPLSPSPLPPPPRPTPREIHSGVIVWLNILPAQSNQELKSHFLEKQC